MLHECWGFFYFLFSASSESQKKKRNPQLMGQKTEEVVRTGETVQEAL